MKARHSLDAHAAGTSRLGEAMMLQRSVERRAALVMLHGGLVRMPRNGSNSPGAGGYIGRWPATLPQARGEQ